MLGSPGREIIAVELSGLAISAALALFFALKRGKGQAELKKTLPFPFLKERPLLLRIFLIVMLVSIFSFFLRSLNHPHGCWDAWAIWNLRARFLFRGGEQWSNAFSSIYAWSHPDYPLLLSGSIARSWNYMGYESVAAPIALAFLFTYSTVGLVTWLVTYLKGQTQGMLAGLILLGFSSFIGLGSCQIADIPFGFYVLCTIGLFFFRERSLEHANGLFALAGVMAGLSAWTKNEGILFVLSVIASHGLITVPARGWKAYLIELRAFLLGLFPILILIVYFKLRFASPNDIFSTQNLRQVVDKLSDLSRYVIIGKFFFLQFYKILKGKMIIFLLLVFLFGVSSYKQYKITGLISSLCLLFMVFGYFIIYLITPHDLVWHLDTSLRRLLLQLLPIEICLFFCLLPTLEPEKAEANEIIGHYPLL